MELALGIREGLDGLDESEILKLYDSVGWVNHTSRPADLAAALKNSTYLVTCCVDGRLIGLARCLSDDVFISYLQEILVDPEFQGRGIGRRLLGKCLARYEHVSTHVLLTDDEMKQKRFYESLGYKNTKDLRLTILNSFVKMKGIDLG